MPKRPEHSPDSSARAPSSRDDAQQSSNSAGSSREQASGSAAEALFEDILLGPAGSEATARPGQFIGGETVGTTLPVGKAKGRHPDAASVDFEDKTEANSAPQQFADAGNAEPYDFAAAAEEFTENPTTNVLDEEELEEASEDELLSLAGAATLPPAQPRATSALPPPPLAASPRLPLQVADETPTPEVGPSLPPLATSPPPQDATAPAHSLTGEEDTPESQPMLHGQGKRRALYGLLGCAIVASGFVGVSALLDGESSKDEELASVAGKTGETGNRGTSGKLEGTAGDKDTDLANIDEGSAANADKNPEPRDGSDKATEHAEADTANDARVAVPESAALLIESVPAGARVYLDGKILGTTPQEIDASPEKHRIALILPGHKLHVAEMDGAKSVKVELAAVAPISGAGGIKVRCKVKDRYYVFVDGADVGQLCPTERIGVKVGSHAVGIYDPVTDTHREFSVQIKDVKRSVRLKVD